MHENSTLDTLIDLALSEDLGEQGDITSKSFIPENRHSSGKIIVKEDCVIAGSEIAERVFNKFDPSIKIDVLLKSGSSLRKSKIQLPVKPVPPNNTACIIIILNFFNYKIIINSKTI